MPSHAKRRGAPTPGLSRNQKLVAGGVVGVVIVLVALFTLVLGHKAATPAGATSSSLPPAATQPTLAKDLCPLTDTPAPGGVVPQRAPIAVKIGNEPGPDAGGLGAARPQSGLNEADIVYDTPAEGGIMRYIAIYQCQNASQIGPVRSYRWVDARILAEFRHSFLLHIGGIAPNLNELNTFAFIKNLDGDCAAESACDSQIYTQDPNRVPPDATYTSTKAVWSQFHSAPYNLAPAPVFRYSAAPPSSAKTVSSVAINFSAGTDALWQWSPSARAFLHFYGTTPDIDQLDNKQVSAQNVVVQVVDYKIGPYEETAGIAGSGDVESQTVGRGRGWVLRDGKVIAVTWHRAALQDPTTFTDAAGKPVDLAPGRTFVEMVINTTADQAGAITFTK